MKLICRKWLPKGNKTVEITPIRVSESPNNVVSLDIDVATWKKIRRTCGKGTDFGFITEDKKGVELIGLN